MVAGCSASPATSPSPLPTEPRATTAPAFSTGDLPDPEVRRVVVDGRELSVAWADDVSERSQGLREVADLGDLDGMLFDMVADTTTTFTMRGTRIPLDIYFFDAAGSGLGMLEMVPCEAEPCPSYSIGSPFRFALEVPAGTLDVEPDASLEIP